MTNEEKAKFLADQCRPCTDYFYSGFIQCAKIALDAECQKPTKCIKDLIEPLEEHGGIIPLREFVKISQGEPLKWGQLNASIGNNVHCEYIDGEGDLMRFGYIAIYRSFFLVNVRTEQIEPVIFQHDLFVKAKEWGFDLTK